MYATRLLRIWRRTSAKSIPPEPDGLATHVNPAVGQEIVDVAQRQAVSRVHDHHQMGWARALTRPGYRRGFISIVGWLVEKRVPALPVDRHPCTQRRSGILSQGVVINAGTGGSDTRV